MPCLPCQARAKAMSDSARSGSLISAAKHAVLGAAEMVGLKDKMALPDNAGIATVPPGYIPQENPPAMDAPNVKRY